MAQVWADVGCDSLLKRALNGTFPSNSLALPAAGDLQLRLYCNNYTPLQTSVAGDFTQAAGGGYAAKTLSYGSFTVTVANDPSDAVYAIQTWTFSGVLTTNPTIYGYYIVDSDGVLVCAELGPAAYTPTSSGTDVLTITYKVQLSSGTPA